MSNAREWAKLGALAIGSVAVMAGCSAGLGAISSSTPELVSESSPIDDEMTRWVQVIESQTPLVDPENPACVEYQSDPPITRCMTPDEVDQDNRDTLKERELLIEQKRTELEAQRASDELKTWRASRIPELGPPAESTPR